MNNPEQGGYPPSQPGGYPPQQPGESQPGGYPPPQPGGYPPPQPGGYPPPQPGGYPPPQQGGYPPQGFAPQQNYTNPSQVNVQPMGGSYPQNGMQPAQPTAPMQWQPSQNQDPNSGPTYDGGDASDTDPEDNENAVPSEDAPPDASGIEAPPGYGFVTFGDAAPSTPAPPPVYEPPPDESERPPEAFGDISTIDEKMIRDAICTFADKKCCYGTRPAQNMTFDDIKAMGALHYQLETFTETRKTCWKHAPHGGGPVDGPHCGQPPAIWDIYCTFDEEFKTHDKIMEVPHTSSVKTCHGCAGCGYRRCHRCHGRGRVRCSSCHGSGRRTVHRDGHSHRESCNWCHGSGKRRCSTCGGDGRVVCHTCTGYGQLRFYIQLTVSYVNNGDDYIHERTDLPDELIRDVSGQVIFEQKLTYVWPISQYHVPEINSNSIALVDRHRTSWPNSKRLQQRHWLRKVPVTEVKYTYKEEQMRFWVYGFEHEVYCPDYPSRCCWGCSIL